jgi:hypothetical protein
MLTIVKTAAKNNYYAPLVAVAIYSVTDNAFLASAIVLKMCSANYFWWYYPTLDFRFADKRWNMCKQFVRFTDTGHLANLLYFLSASSQLEEEGRLDIWPIAFNIHFVITFGYWIARLTLGMQEVQTNDPEYNTKLEDFWVALIHGLPLVFLIKDRVLSTVDVCPYYGTPLYGRLSLGWFYAWFLFMWLPWRLTSGHMD